MKTMHFVCLLVAFCSTTYADYAYAQIHDDECILYSSYFTAESVIVYKDNGEAHTTKEQMSTDVQAAFMYSLLYTDANTLGYTVLHEPYDVWIQGDEESGNAMQPEMVTDVFPQCPTDLLESILASNPTCAHRGSGYFILNTTVVNKYYGRIWDPKANKFRIAGDDFYVGGAKETGQVFISEKDRTELIEYDTLWVCNDSGKFIVTSFFELDKYKKLSYSDIDTSKNRKWLVAKLVRQYHNHNSLAGPVEDDHIAFVGAQCFSESGEYVESENIDYRLSDILKYAIQPCSKLPVDLGLPGIFDYAYSVLDLVKYNNDGVYQQVSLPGYEIPTGTGESENGSSKNNKKQDKEISRIIERYPKKEIDSIIALKPTAAYRYKTKYHMFKKSPGWDDPPPLPMDISVIYDVLFIDTPNKAIFLISEFISWPKLKTFYIIETNKI